MGAINSYLYNILILLEFFVLPLPRLKDPFLQMKIKILLFRVIRKKLSSSYSSPIIQPEVNVNNTDEEFMESPIVYIL